MGEEQKLFPMESLLPGSDEIQITKIGIESEVHHGR